EGCRMSTELVQREGNPFDAMKRTRADGSEFWSARDLCKAVRYETWRNFAAAIDRAQISCQNSGAAAQEHFVGVGKMIDLGKGGRREVEDYELSRFAAYLTVMNGDPRKTEIAAAQAYFAIRTRQAEVVEQKLADSIEMAERRLRLIQAAKGLIDEGHL